MCYVDMSVEKERPAINTSRPLMFLEFYLVGKATVNEDLCHIYYGAVSIPVKVGIWPVTMTWPVSSPASAMDV